MDINDLSKGLEKLSDKIDAIHKDVNNLKIAGAKGDAIITRMLDEFASEKVKTSNNTAGYLAIKQTLVDSLAKSIQDIDNHKELMDAKHEALRDKVDKIQSGQVRFASIVAGISAGIGAGTASILHKFPGLSKLFD